MKEECYRIKKNINTQLRQYTIKHINSKLTLLIKKQETI